MAAVFQLRLTDSNSVIFDFDDQAGIGNPTAEINAATLDLGRQAVLDRILNQRLQQHARNHDIERGRIKLLHHPQFLPAKADDFDIEIVVDEFEFFPQPSKCLTAIQKAPENGRQFKDHVASSVGIEAHQRRNGIEGIKKEVWIDLIL